MRADKIHRAWRRGILSNGKRDRGSLSSFFSFRLVSLVSSFAKEETREMRQRKSKRKWILKNNIIFWNFTFLLFIYNEKEIEKTLIWSLFTPHATVDFMFFTIPPSFSFGKCHLPLHKGGLRLLFIYNEKGIEKIVDIKPVQTSRNAGSFRLLLRKIHLPPGGRLISRRFASPEKTQNCKKQGGRMIFGRTHEGSPHVLGSLV